MPFFNIFSKEKIKEKEIRIIADNREKNALVASYLMEQGIKIEFKQLEIGDYIVNNIAIERKTKSDLVNSIIDKRIFSQLDNLKQYENHIILLEEDNKKTNMSENAIRGFILSVALKFKTPIIYSSNEKDTAEYIRLLANKKKKKENSIRSLKNKISKDEQIQFILEGFPNIGPVKAKLLIEKFKTIKNIANASREELNEVIGKNSEEIYHLFNQELQP
ncbi:MAG: ERCC4 domain-containing protein [Nanoarchaeota archaeon]